MPNPQQPEKGPDNRSFLHIKPTKADKARWVSAARASPHGKLEPWVIDTLNRRCDEADKSYLTFAALIEENDHGINFNHTKNPGGSISPQKRHKARKAGWVPYDGGKEL